MNQLKNRDNPEVKERDNPEVESGDTYFAPFVLVCIIAVLLVIMLTYVLSRAPQVDNNSGSKAMIEGCLSLVLQSQPDKMRRSIPVTLMPTMRTQ